MRKLDILLPFSLPPTELAGDILINLTIPSLATLASRVQNNNTLHINFDVFSPALPHEIWLSKQFGTHTPGGCPAIAYAALHTFNLPFETGHYFVLHPAHIHVARDHLVLTDIRQTHLSESDALALFNEAKPLFDDAGKTLLYGDKNTWLMRADDWNDLQTSTPDAACGHNIDIWLPHSADKTSSSARAWRKLHNEVQIQWFENSINQRRAKHGRQAINSLWCWGGTNTTQAMTVQAYSHTYKLHGWPHYLASSSPNNRFTCDAAQLIADAPIHGLLLLDELIAPALANEWSTWQQQLLAMEERWFQPLLSALKKRQLDQISIKLTDHIRMIELHTTSLTLKKFWITPSLAGLS